jgi:hypothetical protein
MDIQHPDFVQFLKCAGQTGLRYLCFGGYAVNYYGYHRFTDDIDIWIAPTAENKVCFLRTLQCIGYTEAEISKISNEDFSMHFMCTLGDPPNVIDVLTIVHKLISFDEAEKQMSVHQIGDNVSIRMVSYETLKDIKLRSDRQKDWYDIHMLEKLREDNKQ